MLGWPGRSRALTGAAVVLTVVAAGTVVGAGSPAHSGPTHSGPTHSGPIHGGGPAPTAFSTRLVGPVAARPQPRPLVRSDVPRLAGGGLGRLAPVLRQMGPQPGGAAFVGPPGLVGPGSPPAQVRAAQRLLNTHGAQLRVDGDWGPATTRAVRQLQRQRGLPADGQLAPATAARLLH
ncbi:MAG: peptidoglycan-binding domain-containing protein [Mycobacteriales bacterium]